MNYRILLLISFSLSTVLGHAQSMVVEQEGIIESRSLAGYVDVGVEKAPAKGVLVELCSADRKTVIASTETDENGYFAFEKSSAKVFQIRLSSPGINPLWVRVRINKHASHDLKLHLSIST